MYTLTTPCGVITGTGCRLPGIAAFKGIRYATARRFSYPELVTHWEGTYDAAQYGACCYQPRSFYNEEDVPEKAFYYHEFRKGEHYEYSEDCLFLNIWTPEKSWEGQKLPVLVYIHGGGYTGGCGHEKHFDDPIWPTKGVIAVTLNYRLGPLGFACLPDLASKDGHTGNYGLFDQIAALQWIKENISAFGGDSSNITIMGQSAGAMSVQQLCLSPLTDGLFSKAVMSSGGGVNKLLKAAPAETRYEFWQQVMNHAGCKTLDEFRYLPPQQLFTSWQAVKAGNSKYAMAASPCMDGVLLTESSIDTISAGKQKNIPYLIGSTSEDVMPPILFSMAKKWCLIQDNHHHCPSYAWFFDRNLPGDNHGAWHSSDLWYWFGTLQNSWRPFSHHDYELSNQMTDYLTQFAKTGNPNGQDTAENSFEKLPEWLPITANQKSVLRLGNDSIHMGNVNYLKLIYTMLTNKAVGE